MIDESRIEYDVIALPEDMPIEGNASAWGDGTDEPYWQEIRDQLNAGNEWAWCCVKVTAAYPGLNLVGAAYLGGCSYKSRGDFCEEGGYYAVLADEARRDLLRQIEDIRAVIS